MRGIYSDSGDRFVLNWWEG